jgi:hypothetical protein
MSLKGGKPAVAAMLDLFLLDISLGGFAGRIDIRSGSVPANLAATATGTLLAQCDIQDTAVAYGATSTSTLIATGTLVGGVFALETSIIATGTATYFRLFDQGGIARFQGTVGASGSGADMELTTTSLVALGSVVITGSTIELAGLT